MLITRHLFKNLFFATAFIAATLTAVIWLTQSLKLLELVATSDAPIGMFFQMVVLTLPKFLEIIIPLSLVTAVLFVYNKMTLDNELIVLRACGYDQFALARPALALACITSVFLVALTTYISPMGNMEMKQLRQTVKAQYSAFLLREGVFNTFGNDLTVYLRARDAAGDLLGLMIHDARDKSAPPVTITARRGRIVMENDVPNIVVFEGLRQQIDTKTDTMTRLYFARYTLEIKGLDGDVRERWREPNERTFIELFHPDLSDARDRENLQLFRVDAYLRLLSPLNALSFTLVALAGILLGPFNRRGQTRKILAAAIIICALQAASLSLGNLAKQHIRYLPVLYMTTLLPIAAGLFLLHIRGEIWLMSVLRRWRQRHHKADAKGAA